MVKVQATPIAFLLKCFNWGTGTPLNCSSRSHPPPLLAAGVWENQGIHKIPGQNIFTLRFSRLCYQQWTHILIPQASWLPNLSLEGHTTLPQIQCSGTHTGMLVISLSLSFFFINERKDRTKEKKQCLDFLRKWPMYQAAFTEVTNTTAHVLFPISISNLEFGFLVRAYLDIPL